MEFIVNRRRLFSFALGAAALPVFRASAETGAPQLEVFKSPDCSCCSAWVDHMKGAGFKVKVTVVDDTTLARKRYGLPDRFGACHTGIVDGYVIEGHVPASDVKRLLAARPRAIGLAVPSMPPGSPGMEMGSRHDPYDVFLIDKSGHETVFASYPKA